MTFTPMAPAYTVADLITAFGPEVAAECTREQVSDETLERIAEALARPDAKESVR